MQVTLVRLVGYREWTESLGPDREHTIQRVQGRLHSLIVDLFARYGAFAHPLRYDIMFAVTNGLDLKIHEEILQVIERVSPVPVLISIGTGSTVLEAERNASRLCMLIDSHKISFYGNIPDEEPVCVVHADLRDSSRLLEKYSVYETYLYIDRLVRTFRKVMYKMRGVALYLGGDNIVGITTPRMLDINLLQKFSKRYNVRIGVGIDVYSRYAMMKATRALDKLREENIVDVLLIE